MPRNSDTFWSRVLFKDFIRHFRKMSPEQIAEDITESMDALDDLNPDGDSFGSLMVRWANERMNGAFATAARENGKKGGRPRKNQETTADAPTREDGEFKSDSGDAGDLESATSANNSEAMESQRRAGADSVRGTPLHRAPARPRAPFRNKEDFMEWAIDAGLDPVDAGECWEATEERGGKDADGNTVKNMKAFARQWCRTRKDNRRTA